MLSNMRRTDFDVVVVGGGPAGSITAYMLAKSGIRTAILDASDFPRKKPCGGGLQVRTLRDIPFDVRHLFRGTMRRMSLSFGMENPYTRGYSQPLVHNIFRSQFDHYLLQRAEAAGASFFGSTPVRGLDMLADKRVTVRLDHREYTTQFVVGADGANSVVRSFLNDRCDYFWQAAVYCEIPEHRVKSCAYDEDCMIVDWGSLPSGYAWAFPKDGGMNIGAGGPLAAARLLKTYVAKFVERRGLLKSPGQRLDLVGHHLPTLTARTRVASERVVLVGDAAGAVEPFTGDGIAFAVQSGRIASDCIGKALEAGQLDLSGYQSDLCSHIGTELLWSRKLLSVSMSFPRLMHYLFRTNDRVWETFCRTLRGEDSFQRLKRDVLGPLEFAWSLIDRFTQSREQRILGRRRLHSIGELPGAPLQRTWGEHIQSQNSQNGDFADADQDESRVISPEKCG